METTVTAQRVAAEVRAEMARQRKTQADLANLLTSSQAAVSRRLSGEVEFTTGQLLRVASYLGVPIAQLLPTEDAA